MAPVMYLQTGKWVLGVGYFIFCIWAINTVPRDCWASGVRTEIRIVIFLVVGLYALLG